MKEVDLVFLHGFLGQPGDWNSIVNDVLASTGINSDDEANKDICVTIHQVDYMNDDTLSPENSFSEFTENFINYVMQRCHGQKKILIGYSLGGRLALHVLEKKLELFDFYLLISCHTGLLFENEKEERLKQDLNWSKLFLSESFEEVIKKWNQQEVFSVVRQDSNLIKVPNRNESDYNKKLLALVLDHWSLARQSSKLDQFALNKDKIIYCVGENDIKFLNFAHKYLYQIIGNKLHIIKNAGHRIIFDNPKEIVELIKNLISAFSK